VLTQAELALVLRVVDGMGYPWRPFYLLLILTACRRDEAAGARWEEISLEEAIWRIPKERTKNGKPHALELCEMAVELLQELPRSPSGYVLTTNNRSPISGYSKAKRALDAKLAELGSGVAPFRIHDLRRSAATHMAEYLNADESLIERILGHMTFTGGLKGIYQRQTYAVKKRALMAEWGAYVEKLQSGSALAVSNA
jgi:integrase